LPATIAGLRSDSILACRPRARLLSVLNAQAEGNFGEVQAAKDAIPALERVRDKYRSAPQNERALADVAKSAAEQIRKAKHKLPARST
jgi:hypothetical protein